MDFSFRVLIEAVISLAEGCYVAMLDLFTLFTTPIATLINTFVLSQTFPTPIGEIIAIITAPLTNSIFGNYSLVTFMLGGGIAVYLLWQLVAWILNIIT